MSTSSPASPSSEPASKRAHSGAAISADTAGVIQNTTKLAPQGGKKRKRESKFDPTLYEYRQIALGVLYLGHSYHGLAAAVAHAPSTPRSTDSVALDTNCSVAGHDAIPTIEGELFKALDGTKLLPPGGRSASNFSRCGRTDAGVSALGQVVSLKVRSKAKVDEEVPSMQDELDYIRMLNAVLPDDIRVTGWCPVEEEFSARFCAGYRVYRYYFPKRGMDTQLMQQAASSLVGTHDFRNFCKPDVMKVTTFERSILSFNVLPCTPVGTDSAAASHTGLSSTTPKAAALSERHSMWYFEIVGQAFLWHQVRCMAAVLFRVGRGVEAPSITQQLLDVSAVPQKPQFAMAHQEALCLYFCHFHDLPLWASPQALKALLASVEGVWSKAAVRCAMLSDMLTSLYRLPVMPSPPADCTSQLVSVYEADLQECNAENGTTSGAGTSSLGAGTVPDRSPEQLQRLAAVVAKSRNAPPRGISLGAPSTLQYAETAAPGSVDPASNPSAVVLGAAATTVPRVTLPVSLLPGTASAGRHLEQQHYDVFRDPPSLSAVVACLEDSGASCPPAAAEAGGGACGEGGVAPAVVALPHIASGQARAALSAAIKAVQEVAAATPIGSAQELLQAAAALPGGGKGGPAKVTHVSLLAPPPAPDAEVETECPLKTRKYTPLLHPSHKREPSIQERLRRRGLESLPSKVAVLQAGGTQASKD